MEISLYIGKVCLAIDSTLDRKVSSSPYSAILDTTIGNSNVTFAHAAHTYLQYLLVFVHN